MPRPRRTYSDDVAEFGEEAANYLAKSPRSGQVRYRLRNPELVLEQSKASNRICYKAKRQASLKRRTWRGEWNKASLAKEIQFHARRGRDAADIAIRLVCPVSIVIQTLKKIAP